jgi:hypothetical protein
MKSLGGIDKMLSWVEWQRDMESCYNFMPKWYWNYELRRKTYEDYVDSYEKKHNKNPRNLDEAF